MGHDCITLKQIIKVVLVKFTIRTFSVSCLSGLKFHQHGNIVKIEKCLTVACFLIATG